jgi:tetratricopeptide (TPR) repeat protein
MTATLARITFFSFLFLLFIPYLTPAESKTFTKEYTYQASEEDSRNSCRITSLREVKRLLLEELGTYLESITEVQNFQLTKDQITMLTAGIVKTEIVDEKWDGHTYWIKSKITADSSNVIKSIDALRKDRQKTKELEEVRKLSDELLKDNERLRKELATASGEKKKKDTEAYNKNIAGLSAAEWAEKGSAAYISGNSNDAIAAFSKAIEVSPKYASAYIGRGNAYMQLRNYLQAIKEFDKAIEINPKESAAYFRRGNAYGDLGNYRQALEDYNRAIELDPEYESFYLHFRGPIHSALGNYHKAIEDFSKIIQTSPKSVYIYSDRASAYAKLGNYKDAIRDYDKAIELDTYDKDSYYRRGLAYLSLGNPRQAIKDIDKAIKGDMESIKFNEIFIDPDTGRKNSSYGKKLLENMGMKYMNRGNAYSDLSNYKQAIKDYSKAIELNPKSDISYYNRGIAYYKLGNKNKAISDYSKAIEVNPLYAHAYFIRGLFYGSLGNRNQADKDCKIAARLGHKEAQDYLTEKGIDWTEGLPKTTSSEDGSQNPEKNAKSSSSAMSPNKPQQKPVENIELSTDTDLRYRGIKGIVLKNGDVIEGQILNMDTNIVKIRTKDGKVSSYSFQNEVERFINE